MSDEELLGKTCCIPKRLYMLFVATGFAMYGVYNALYFIIFAYTKQGKMTPSHCSGIDCSSDILSCKGTLESSYHFRVCVMAIGSLVFGISGINAIFNKYASEMFNFAVWLVFAAALTATVALLDASYLVLCTKHLSYNVVQEALLWPITHLPVHNGIKYEVGHMNSYPKAYVNALSGHNVFSWYCLFSGLKVAFLAHAAWTCFKLAQRFHFGVAGMGANFSIEGWRKRLMMRYEISEVAANSLGMAGATVDDMDWREDEYLMSKSRGRHWYRGYMPEAAARAYDGFRDDRMNVLL